MSNRISLVMNKALHERCQTVAAAQNQSLSHWVRGLCIRELERLDSEKPKSETANVRSR